VARARRRPLRRARICTAAAALALIASVVAPGTALALPHGFWGVSPQATPSVEQFQRLRNGGVESVRIPMSWSAVEPTRGGAPQFSSIDPLVAGAAAAGLEVLPFAYGAPKWAVPTAVVPGSHGLTKAPLTLPVKSSLQRSSWAKFLQLLVGRYGPNGSFWAENPGLPKRPIRTWQIWNEPNFKYFVVRPNPADYGKLLKVSYAAIHGADHGAKLILAGLFARPNEAKFKLKPPQAYFAPDFLEQMYRSTPGVGSTFVGVALHPYTSTYKRLIPYVEEFRQALVRNGGGGKGLWITEIGWSSERASRGDSFAKGPSGQVAQLDGAFKLFKQKAARWKLKQVDWFSVDDAPGNCNFCGGSGLFAKGFVPKKAWFAYVHFAGGRP
jgi:polysaccharide biosynthesis protein PslG